MKSLAQRRYLLNVNFYDNLAFSKSLLYFMKETMLKETS